MCWFEVFFSNPLWQMLTKVDSKDNPKSKPIVHIYFLKRAILGVLNMKQDQTVKQILYKADSCLTKPMRGGLGKREIIADCLLCGFQAPTSPALCLFLGTYMIFF